MHPNELLPALGKQVLLFRRNTGRPVIAVLKQLLDDGRTAAVRPQGHGHDVIIETDMLKLWKKGLGEEPLPNPTEELPSSPSAPSTEHVVWRKNTGELYVSRGVWTYELTKAHKYAGLKGAAVAAARIRSTATGEFRDAEPLLVKKWKQPEVSSYSMPVSSEISTSTPTAVAVVAEDLYEQALESEILYLETRLRYTKKMLEEYHAERKG